MFHQMGASKRDNALRKIVGLRAKSVERGASPSEAENARKISNFLMKKHGIELGDVVRASQQDEAKPDWSRWENVLQRHGHHLDKFGSRGQVRLPNGHTIHIERDAGWRAHDHLNRQVAQGSSSQHLHDYLSRQPVPHHYSLQCLH
jgi:hypothetical protein